MNSEPTRPLALLLLAGLALAASAAPPEPDSKSVEVRLLPLGDKPKLAMHYVNGVYTQMPYDPREVPPARVRLDDAKKPTLFLLDLNRPTVLPGGVKTAGKLTFSQPPNEKNAEARPWAACTLPAKCTKALLILHPSASGNWLKPRILPEDISPARLTEPGLRLLNHSNRQLEGEVGPVRVTLRPGGSAFVPASRLSGDYVVFKFARVTSDGAREPEIDRTAQLPRHRVDFYVIRPTAQLPGRQVAVCEFSEPLNPDTPAPGAAPAR